MEPQTTPIDAVLDAVKLVQTQRKSAIDWLEKRRAEVEADMRKQLAEIDATLKALGKPRVGRPPKFQGASKRLRVGKGGQGVSDPVAQACSTMAGTVAWPASTPEGGQK